MKIAITGGTGFIGRTLARKLVADGHHVVLIARGIDQTDPTLSELPNSEFVHLSLQDTEQLAKAFEGCDAIAHCGGINRELGEHTFERVHQQGTLNVTTAAKTAGVRKIVLTSFLRARPDCGSAYHETKWAAEEIVRESGLDFTILKPGVIYGPGDHMLDHLCHAFCTFPVFAFVGFNDQSIRPLAVADLVNVMSSALVEGRLERQTVAVLGPETLTLRTAVRRVAKVVGKRPIMFPMPVWFHRIMALILERIMVAPMVSQAQVTMLVEGVTEPTGPCESLPHDLMPAQRFTEELIRAGLPPKKRFTSNDLLLCRRTRAGGPA